MLMEGGLFRNCCLDPHNSNGFMTGVPGISWTSEMYYLYKFPLNNSKTQGEFTQQEDWSVIIGTPAPLSTACTFPLAPASLQISPVTGHVHLEMSPPTHLNLWCNQRGVPPLVPSLSPLGVPSPCPCSRPLLQRHKSSSFSILGSPLWGWEPLFSTNQINERNILRSSMFWKPERLN